MARYRIWPFEPSLFIGDTQHLNAREGWAYFRLLCYYWINRRLPDDDRELARIAKIDLRTWRRWYRKRLQKFFYDGWKHKRMERDLAHAAAFAAKQRRTALGRWHVSTPVDNGEAEMLASPKGRQNKINDLADATAMPLKSKITTSPFGTRRSADVDNLKNLAQTSKVAYDGNPPPNDSPNPAYRRAQQRLLRTLLTDLGERAFAELIDTFAADADLLHRATVAEQRKPNSGAAFVVNQLQRVR